MKLFFIVLPFQIVALVTVLMEKEFMRLINIMIEGFDSYLLFIRHNILKLFQFP